MGFFSKLFRKKDKSISWIIPLYFDKDKLCIDKKSGSFLEIREYVDVLQGKKDFSDFANKFLQEIKLTPEDFAILCCSLICCHDNLNCEKLKKLLPAESYEKIEKLVNEINPYHSQLSSISVLAYLEKKEEKNKEIQFQQVEPQQEPELFDFSEDEFGENFIPILLDDKEESEGEKNEEENLEYYIEINIATETPRITSYYKRVDNSKTDYHNISINKPSLARREIYFDGNQFSITELKIEKGSSLLSDYISQIGKDLPNFKREITNLLVPKEINPNRFAILSTMFFIANLLQHMDCDENENVKYILQVPRNINNELADTLLSGALALCSNTMSVCILKLQSVEDILKRNNIDLERFIPKSNEEDFIPILEDSEEEKIIVGDASPSIKEDFRYELAYLGIDFGTSFTKLSYYIGENDHECIRSNDGYFLPTEVFYDGENLSFTKESDKYLRVQYFKYDMIPGKGTSTLISQEVSDLIPKGMSLQTFASICAAFYIANVINICDSFIKAQNYRINMGVPFTPQEKDNYIFEEILKIGYYFHKTSKLGKVSLSNLRESYASLKGNSKEFKLENANLITTPEIVAEADFLLSRETYQSGDYIIADIGGGTADFAYLRKCEVVENGEYNAISFMVVPLGVATKEKYGVSDYRKRLTGAFKDFLKLTKRNLATDLQKDAKFLLFGGGSFDTDVQSVFYHSCIFKEALSQFKLNIIKDENLFPKNYFINELALSDEEKKRLVITTQLANPMQPELATLPLRPDAPAPEKNDPIITSTKKTFTFIVGRDGLVERIER